MKPNAVTLRPAKCRSEVSTCPWDQWLAGFIDADGYIGLSKAGQLVCEVTTDVYDEAMLRECQAAFGGSVKPRSGSASMRWRLSDRAGLVALLERINGLVRYGVRAHQVRSACAVLNMTPLSPRPLSYNTGYVAGLWDGDGSITIGVAKSSAKHSVLPGRYGKMMRLLYSRGHHQLSIHIDSNDQALLHQVQKALNLGVIIPKRPSEDPVQRRPNLNYRLFWRDYESVQRWRAYLRLTRAGRSVKHRRLLLLERFFELKSQKAHLAPEHSGPWKRWRDFCVRWHNIEV